MSSYVRFGTNALKKNRDRSSSAEADIEAALRILTGLELPEKTSIQEWQKAFNQKYDSADLNKSAARQCVG
jgi:hypothetical protein